MATRAVYGSFKRLLTQGYCGKGKVIFPITGEEEGSLFGGVPGARVEATPEGTALVEVPQPRRFYCLTAKGKEAPDVAWSDPLQALYEYSPEYRHKKAERLYCPGGLPRTVKPKRRLK